MHPPTSQDEVAPASPGSVDRRRQGHELRAWLELEGPAGPRLPEQVELDDRSAVAWASKRDAPELVVLSDQVDSAKGDSPVAKPLGHVANLYGPKWRGLAREDPRDGLPELPEEPHGRPARAGISSSGSKSPRPTAAKALGEAP